MPPNSNHLRTCAENRRKLLDKYEDEVLIIPGNFLRQKNSDVHYDFRQNSDFAYLCPYPEPDSLILLDAADRNFTLFVPPKDPHRELWDGPRHGVDGARDIFQADRVFSNENMSSKIPELVRNRRVLF